MKKLTLITPALVLATVTAARAAVQVVPMPSLPVSLPARAGIEVVKLPSVPLHPAAGEILLPGVGIGQPMSLPSNPHQMPSIRPGVILPGPTLIPGIKPKRIAVLKADGQQARPSAAEQLQEKARELDRIFDNNQRQIAEDRHYTLPESDLLDEIGVGHHYR
jgi:hypothetical protein